MFSPQIGVSQVLSKFLIEAYAGAWIFTDNSDFIGGSTLSQDPLYAFGLHVGYRFCRGLWLAASSRQSLGGETSVDGSEKQSYESNNRIGITLAVPLGSRYSLKLTGTKGSTSTAGNDYDTLAAVWQAAF